MTDRRRRTYRAADALLATLRSVSVEVVVMSPGSRSTPLVLAAAAVGPPMRVVLDERSAGFVALGVAKASGRPAALICTSGSAAANYLPAVVEADRARVPLVVITADRPPGFLAQDAPQTIHQVGLYRSHVRASASLPVAHESDPRMVVEEAFRVVRAARPPNAGPVHINFPAAKPLEPPPGSRDRVRIPARALAPRASPAVDRGSADALARFVEASHRGVIVAGPRETGSTERTAIRRFSRASGWPILADALSGLRSRDHRNLVTGADLLLRAPAFAAGHQPGAVLRIGATPTGSATQAWLSRLEAPEAALDPDFRRTGSGPDLLLRDPVAPLLDAVSPAPPGAGWSESWRNAERGMRRRRVTERRRHRETELAVTAAVLESEPVVWAASSMPVRHVDAMMAPGCGAGVLANRGASGIDGTLASAAGAALALGRRVTVLIGDLAFLHDIGSLATARRLGVDLTAVVLDNGGGAIFENLPYLRSLRESGAATVYEEGRRLFVTPHDHDLVAVAAGFGVSAGRVPPAGLAGELDAARSGGGVRILVVDSDPKAMFDAYDRLAGGAARLPSAPAAS